MNAQQTEDAARNEDDPFHAAMLATGWRLTDSPTGPLWWRELNGARQTRPFAMRWLELIAWLQDRPEIRDERRELSLLSRPDSPAMPRYSARLHYPRRDFNAETRDARGFEHALAKLVALVAMLERR